MWLHVCDWVYFVFVFGVVSVFHILSGMFCVALFVLFVCYFVDCGCYVNYVCGCVCVLFVALFMCGS